MLSEDFLIVIFAVLCGLVLHLMLLPEVLQGFKMASFGGEATLQHRACGVIQMTAGLMTELVSIYIVLTSTRALDVALNAVVFAFVT